MRNTADVTHGKPIAVLLQPILCVSAINPLVTFYDIHGEKGEVLFFYFDADTTRDKMKNKWNKRLFSADDVEIFIVVFTTSSVSAKTNYNYHFLVQLDKLLKLLGF
jgi:hypothetical protein